MSSVVVDARALGKRYGEVVALDRLDLEVRAGEVLGLLGPNGAGKTTTIKVLTTLERADSGAATIFDLDVATRPDAVRARIGYVPQELAADRYLTARESLTFFCRLYRVAKDKQAARVDQLIELLGLEEAADRQLRTFSGGMKKKLDLACGLVHEPGLLFLDEPSLGLDVAVRRALWDHVEGLKRRGVTVILATNYMDEADRLCDRIAVIDRGKVAALGTPTELRAGLGGDVVTLEISDAAARAKADGVLAELDEVGATYAEGPRLHLTVSANETALPKLLAACRDAGVAVDGASYHRPGLEEVFVHHTGRRFVDAHGQSGAPPRRRR